MTRSEPKTEHSGSSAADAVLRVLQGDDTPASERQGAAVTSFLHTLGLDAGTYSRLLEARGSGAAETTAFDFVEQYLEQIQPRDQLERMLAIQSLWQHIRVSSLCLREAHCTDAKEASAIRTAIEQAMNTFRRQVQALRDLQTPRPVNLIRGGQINVGNEQVINNNVLNTQTPPANELGWTDGRQETVSADARGTCEPEGVRSKCRALDPVDGPQNAGGEGRLQPECVQARSAMR